MAQDSPKMAQDCPYAKFALVTKKLAPANCALRKICPGKFCVTQNLPRQILCKLARCASRIAQSLPEHRGGKFCITQQLRNFCQGNFLRKLCVTQFLHTYGEGCFCCCCCCCNFWLRLSLLLLLLLPLPVFTHSYVMLTPRPRSPLAPSTVILAACPAAATAGGRGGGGGAGRGSGFATQEGNRL